MMQTEYIATYIKAKFQQFSEETDENHEKHQTGKPVTGLRFEFCTSRICRPNQEI
jgi:hypothetical protein